jgi:hypothetical protein
MLHKPRTPFDVCSNNHGGNAESRAANLTTNKEADRQKIIDFMLSRPHRSTWVKEVIRELGLPHQTASARLSDMKADGTIEPTGEKREKCGVVRLVATEPVQTELF